MVVIAALCARLMSDATVHHALDGVAAGAAGMTMSMWRPKLNPLAVLAAAAVAAAFLAGPG